MVGEAIRWARYCCELRRSIKNVLAAPERNCLVNVKVNGKFSEKSSCASSDLLLFLLAFEHSREYLVH